MNESIEEIVIRHLTEALETENIYAERPETPPESYWLIKKTGGSEEDFIRSAMIAVQSITSVSLLQASEMNRAAIRGMKRLEEETNISRCKLNSDYNFTDTSTKQYRYQAVFDITYMEGE